MKSLLILAPNPQFAEDVRQALRSDDLRIVYRQSVEEAEPLLVREHTQICLVDLDIAGIQGVWTIERILRRAPGCSVIVFAESRDPEWEEELYLAGAAFVFGKPVRGRLLAKTIAGLSEGRKPTEDPIPAVSPAVPEPTFSERENHNSGHAAQNLAAIQNISKVLAHPLDSRAFARQFLAFLRETMGINRAAILLKPANISGWRPEAAAGDEPWMCVACATGVATSLHGQLQLTRDSGIGAFVIRTGRILQRHNRVGMDPLAIREFDTIGAEVAIPIMGLEQMVGVALLDRKVTGDPLTRSELETLFQLLEQVGHAISNISIHGRLQDSNQLLGDVLKELGSACVVVSQDLTVLQVNRAARRLLGGASRRSGTIEFSELPQVLGAKIYQVLRTGAAVPAFRYQSDDSGKSIYSISVVPVRTASDSHAALLVADDRTQAEQLKELEVETANLRLVNNMADRLAAEIGNAIVPLSVHYQLFDDRIKEAEFRKSLKSAMGDAVKRVGRLASQMRFIYGNPNRSKVDKNALTELLKKADEEAQGNLGAKKATMQLDDSVAEVTLSGDESALAHAFSEILLNGYQASGETPNITVRVAPPREVNQKKQIAISFVDVGKGFSKDTAEQALLPFYTTKTAGVGLGLSAAKKIIEDHGGSIEIPAAHHGKQGVVDVYLPQESA